jgi:putative membrane protein insertion efficiency factor
MNALLGKILSLVIKLYQLTLGTVFGGRCRYYPTCSEYARQALIKDGAVKGLAKSGWRLLRCNPFSRGGYDPVK